MTKEEKIKEAWGYFGGEVDDNGWRLIQSKFINKVKNIEISGCGKYYRPKTLQGIEDNNGWIKIESEDDLPKDIYGLYNLTHIERDNFLYAETYYILYSFWRSGTVTHYQPIEKPKPPIY